MITKILLIISSLAFSTFAETLVTDSFSYSPAPPLKNQRPLETSFDQGAVFVEMLQSANSKNVTWNVTKKNIPTFTSELLAKIKAEVELLGIKSIDVVSTDAITVKDIKDVLYICAMLKMPIHSFTLFDGSQLWDGNVLNSAFKAYEKNTGNKINTIVIINSNMSKEAMEKIYEAFDTVEISSLWVSRSDTEKTVAQYAGDNAALIKIDALDLTIEGLQDVLETLVQRIDSGELQDSTTIMLSNVPASWRAEIEELGKILKTPSLPNKFNKTERYIRLVALFDDGLYYINFI